MPPLAIAMNKVQNRKIGGNKSNEGTPKAPVKKDATAVIPARFIPKQKKSVMVQKSKITSFFGTACDD